MQTISSQLPSAIFSEVEGPDTTVAWHYGDPFAEQRKLASGQGTVDLSNHGVIEISGADRLEFLHALTTNHLTRLQPGESTLTLNLSNTGFLLHELHVIEDAERLFVIVRPGDVEEIAGYLRKMRFRMQVEVIDVSGLYAVLWQPIWQVHSEFPTWLVPTSFDFAGREILVPRDAALSVLSAEPVGMWAREALRVAAKVARQGFESDHHTIPMEAGWLEGAIHMNKGCYRGQETISKVVRMGQPPRRLELVLLSGEGDLPSHGTEVLLEDKVVGFVGTAVQHFELGPIATVLVKRNVPVDATLSILGEPANQMAKA
jgi:tRNA-modifying protein YgfZ